VKDGSEFFALIFVASFHEVISPDSNHIHFVRVHFIRAPRVEKHEKLAVWYLPDASDLKTAALMAAPSGRLTAAPSPLATDALRPLRNESSILAA
jgi:hypothetical protein